MAMIDESELPDEEIERAAMLEGVLMARATGNPAEEGIYTLLRREFMADPLLKGLLPSFVRTNRSLGAFWEYIKQQAGTYAERRQIIGGAFLPLMDHLEGANSVPADQVTSDALEAFDEQGVHAVWAKALARRNADPEGAITIARTLLETVTKRILDEMHEPYSDKDDLPKLYASTATALNLGPSQHTEEPIRAILGGAMNMVNGIGTLRNRLSDSHGRGGRLPVRPSSRHAHLAVNTAGAVATFLAETFLERRRRP